MQMLNPRYAPLRALFTLLGKVRPNILMYQDNEFDTSRSDHQQKNFKTMIDNLIRTKKKFVVLEVGANKEIPTLRMLSEQILAAAENAT